MVTFELAAGQIKAQPTLGELLDGEWFIVREATPVQLRLCGLSTKQPEPDYNRCLPVASLTTGSVTWLPYDILVYRVVPLKVSDADASRDPTIKYVLRPPGPTGAR